LGRVPFHESGAKTALRILSSLVGNRTPRTVRQTVGLDRPLVVLAVDLADYCGRRDFCAGYRSCLRVLVRENNSLGSC
jgi:hypothetical protein